MNDPFQEYLVKFEKENIIHFKPHEFSCRCGSPLCEVLILDMDFISYLDDFRQSMAMPFRITSGYRCPMHPIEAKKTHPGPHQTGKAADIAVLGLEAYKFLFGLGMHNAHGDPFVGIGLNQKGDHDERFIHLDMCDSMPYRPRPHVWTY